jgi:hypothetical protein
MEQYSLGLENEILDFRISSRISINLIKKKYFIIIGDSNPLGLENEILDFKCLLAERVKVRQWIVSPNKGS